MDKHQNTAFNAPTEDDTHAASAVHSEVSTTKTPDQKAEIASELFPPVPAKRQLKTRRVIH